MKKLDYKDLFFLVIAIVLSPMIKGQVASVIYVDISGQSNRTNLISLVDSVLSNTPGEKLLFISNGGTPLVFQNANLGVNETKSLNTLDPSLPNPYLDLDSLVQLVNTENFYTEDLQLHFFLSYQNAFKGEKHLENIAEKFALSLGLVQKQGVFQEQAMAYLNLEGDTPKELNQSSFREAQSRIFKIKAYQ
ncbi:MAG: hypothetical protein DA405_07640 [Bacteroidetes bacterium]|nr:MAG: hypothetical protein DA405_07640 [Bacteroidota bacterium]